MDWRAIPLETVRAHPCYESLPPARDVVRGAPVLARAALLRQDTWRWDLLHEGRLTGSRVAAACETRVSKLEGRGDAAATTWMVSGRIVRTRRCGLLEADAAAALSIPRSLAGRNRALAAANHLRGRPASGTVAAAFAPDDGEEEDDDDDDADDSWCADAASAYARAFVGTAPPPRGYSDATRARLAWGKRQEGVGILAAPDRADIFEGSRRRRGDAAATLRRRRASSAAGGVERRSRAGRQLRRRPRARRRGGLRGRFALRGGLGRGVGGPRRRGLAPRRRAGRRMLRRALGEAARGRGRPAVAWGRAAAAGVDRSRRREPGRRRGPSGRVR